MKSDAEIKHDVEAELSWAPEVDAIDIAVAVSGSVVSLSGFARNLFEKYAAARAARRIRPTVHEGRIFLEGRVQWRFQRQRAESVMRRVPGIMGVRNSIELAPSVEPKEVARTIEAAFRRSGDLDAAGIAVEAHGPEVTLRGEVRSWAERDQAQQTAWAAPGVTSVFSEIRVRV